MADNNAVVWSIGFVESWIEKAADLANKDLTVANSEAALNHLTIIESAFHENRRTVEALRSVLRDISARADAGTKL